MSNLPIENNFYKEVIQLLKVARAEAVRSVNRRMVVAYYEVGKMIIEKEQEGKHRHWLRNLEKDFPQPTFGK